MEMDISDMIGGAKKPTPVRLDNDEIDMKPHDLDEHDEAPASEIGESADDADAEMTAVQRIQAYRDGTLSAPMVGRLDNANDVPCGDNADNGGDCGDGEEYADHDPVDGELTDGNSDDADDDSDNNAEERRGNGPKNLLAGFPGGNGGPKIPRRALLIGVPAAAALIGAGVLLPGLGGKDKPAGPPVVQQAGAHPSTTTNVPAVSPDTVIKPANVEGPAYPISVTPPADAFSGEKGKGWVCSGLDGTVLTITLPGPTAVSEIAIMPGLEGVDADGSPRWGKHRLVSKVAFGFDYGDPVYADLVDKEQMQPTTFKGVITRTITITILYTTDISGKGPGAGGDTSSGPGILGDLGKTGLDPSASTAPSTSSADSSRPPTFAIGAIQIMGHTPS